jgi:hypothetical protein
MSQSEGIVFVEVSVVVPVIVEVTVEEVSVDDTVVV